MKIDAKFFGAILFLIAQTSGAIWWASSLSAEVERLAGIQAVAIPALEKKLRTVGLPYIIMKLQYKSFKSMIKLSQG